MHEKGNRAQSAVKNSSRGEMRQSSAADCLRDRKESILKEWEERIRKVIPESTEKASVVIRNSIPNFIDQLIDSLASKRPRLASSEDIGQSHAVQRTEYTDFKLTQVMTEYNVLRQIIFQTLDQIPLSLSGQDRDIIIDYIQNGKMAAADRYTELAFERITRGERTYRALFDLSCAGIVLSEPKTGCFVQVNPRFAEMLGYSPSELLGKSIKDVTYPEDYEKQYRIYQDAVRNETPKWTLEKRYIRKDGSLFWAELWATLLRDDLGRPELIMANVLDITERKQEEENRKKLLELEQGARREAEESAALFESTLATAPIGTALIDRELRYVQANQALADLNGISIEDHLGKSIREVIPEAADVIEPLLRKIFETGKPMLNHEFNGELLKGRASHTLANYYPIPDPSGKIWAIGAMVVDITERRRLEEERERLLQSEKEARTRAEDAIQKLQDLLGLTTSAVSKSTSLDQLLEGAVSYAHFSFHADTVAILLATEAGDAIEVRAAHGLEEEIIQKVTIPKGKGVAGRIMAEERPLVIDDLSGVETASPVIKEKGVQCLMGAPLRTKEHTIGVIHVGRLERKPFNQAEVQFLQLVADRLATAIDNSRLYTDLHRKLDELRKERELRERFVATLAHDLRNPLAAARMSAGLALRYPERPEAREKQLAKIVHSLLRADQMIENLLDANRIRAGERLPLEVAECDFRSIVQDVCEEQFMIYGDRFVIESPNTVLGYWSCNGIRRIMENLISNAAKYGTPNTPVTTRIELKNDRVLVSVHNQGPPIPEDEQKTIFEPFHRASGVEVKGKPGWGLGLTLVRGLADAHGGRVSLQSTPAEGTTFTVDLPADARPFQVPRI
jgi:PAS domain S-box-containing protein